MKQLISTITATLMLAFIMNVHAQKARSGAGAESFINNDEVNALYKGVAINDADVNAKALKDFSKSFKGVNNVQWYGVSDGFMAGFTENGIETKVAYDIKGNWQCNLRTYGENKMPSGVRGIVKSQYYDFNIQVVYEITHSDNVTYIIKIDNEKNLKALRITNGEMEVIAEYVRG